ncbi:MAG TPA: cellulase family glycosylhydrolase [Caulobacteraceae bacterium]|nr:cellulase family glycosylhydrolase [Caulobacteraceae bacterium]
MLRIKAAGDRFVDAAGRQVMLRGVNLGGDCKLPYPHGGCDHPSDFSDHREVSFIGRPFPIEEADEHLGRLRHWGFNGLRLLTTWEAVEHAGPGLYDEAYLDYLAEICARASEHGLYLFIDFHQDVWSRMSGGDGAPGWTFEAVGLDFTTFPRAGAAHVMQAEFDYADPNPRQAAYPQMSWNSNYVRPANGIMWSLFWGGRILTPDLLIDGRNVQDFLQAHYFGCMDQVARRVKHLPNVVGFDSLNEPSLGWIGRRLSHRRLAVSADDQTLLRAGVVWSPLDGLAVARGMTLDLPVLKRDPVTGAVAPEGHRTVNAARVPIWRPGVECPFERAGAYRVEGDTIRALDEDFFLKTNADAAFAPFFGAAADVVRRHCDDWSLFAEIDVYSAFEGEPFPDGLPERSVNANHWYDIATLMTKSFAPARSGPDAVAERKALYARQLAPYGAVSAAVPGGAPTLIGEFGVPFDLDDGAAYQRWAAGERGAAPWREHSQALAAMYDVLDSLLFHSTQWNYTASNRNDLRIGDGWNQEDLSIFSRDQQDDPADPDSGGRAIEGFCRPRALCVQGRLLSFAFDEAAGTVRLSLDVDPTIRLPTEIYVPRRRFPDGVAVSLDPPGALQVKDGQMLEILSDRAGRLEIELRRL